jgi:DnaJ-class molecular chaperone
MCDGQYDIEQCAWCYGMGRRGASERCSVCGGEGGVMVLQPAHRCIKCDCSGRVGNLMEPCSRCHGAGWEGVLQPTDQESQK